MNELEEIKSFLYKDNGFERGVKRSSTLEQYAVLLNDYFGLAVLKRSDPKEIETLLLNLVSPKRGIASSMTTKTKVYYALLKWYRLARNAQVLGFLNSTRVSYKKSRKERFLSFNEVNALLKSCKTQEEKVLIGIMVFTGVRLSVIYNLKKENVKMDSGRLYIPAKMDGNKKCLDYYTEPMNPKFFADLVQYIELKRKKDFVFSLGQESKSLSMSSRKIRLRTKINNIAKAAKIDNFTPHTLRHTHGIMLYSAYKDVVRCRDSLGHTSVSSTDIYIRYDEGWQKQAKAFLRGDYYGE